MSDLIKCGYCGKEYWVHGRENWGTCACCSKNNDFADEKHLPSLLSEFREPLLEKAIKIVKESEND